MVEVAENSLSDDAKYDPDHTIIDQDDVDSSKIDPFAESGHKFINSQCHCREIALQLKHMKHDIHQLKSRTETCDANENTWVCKISTCSSEKALLKSQLEETNDTIKDLNAKIVHLQEEKYSLVTALTLQQKDYQTCLNNLYLQNNRSVETSNNFQIVHGTKSSNQTQNERNTPTIYTLKYRKSVSNLERYPRYQDTNRGSNL